MKAALVGQPKAFDGGEAEVSGEVAQLGLEAGERVEGADDMALEGMPKGDAESSRATATAARLRRVATVAGRLPPRPHFCATRGRSGFIPIGWSIPLVGAGVAATWLPIGVAFLFVRYSMTHKCVSLLVCFCFSSPG